MFQSQWFLISAVNRTNQTRVLICHEVQRWFADIDWCLWGWTNQTPANIILLKSCNGQQNKAQRQNLFFTLVSIARLELVRELFQNTYYVTIHTGYINMPNVLIHVIRIKLLPPLPSVVINPNCVLNHFMSFYDIQMPELLPNPIKKKHVWWLGNHCVLNVPQVILICSQDWAPLPYIKKTIKHKVTEFVRKIDNTIYHKINKHL